MPKRPTPHPILKTPRLRLRQFCDEDADAMHECFANPEAMRFWNHSVHTKRIETERVVRRLIDCTPSYYRFWAVAEAESDRCLGMVNYHDGHIRSKRVAIGYIIDPARQRDGIATEAVSAMLDFCFGELGLHRVQAFIHPDNTASRKLVEKLGVRTI
jgi:[ribosomal protein S5]-alanine N-acetyltransferase